VDGESDALGESDGLCEVDGERLVLGESDGD
jgi:hypothetical protein